MKNSIKLLCIAVAITFATASCDLDRFPYDSIEQTQAFKSMNDAASLRNGLYSQLRGRVYGIYTFTTDVQADQLNATLDYGNRNGSPHKWTTFLADDYSIRDIWQYSYNSIANINNFIENADLISPEDEAEEAELQNYMGEAYFLRAFYYHRLVQLWAKDYEPSTASTDLGVPVVLTFDVALLPSRSTVQAVYDQILADISLAETMLADVPGEQCATRITIDCVKALKARVQLCMHNYTGAAATADAIINTGNYPLIDNASDLYEMWTNDVSTEVIFQPYCSVTELSNANDIYLRYSSAISRFVPDFVPQQWVIDMYDNADIRKSVYLGQKTIQIQGTDYANVYCITKFPGNSDLFTSAVSNYQHMPKLFRSAELYLISAEAKAHSSATETSALATLNELRTKRGLTELTGISGTTLMTAIMEERTRELLCEGFRLDDLKRWGLGFSRKTPQNTEFINVGVDFDQKVVAAGADKFVWGIPTNDITTNPSIADQQNPGW